MMIKVDFVLACLSALVLEVVADLQKKKLLLLLLCGPSGQIQHNKISCKISVLLDKATHMTLVQQTSQGRKKGRKEGRKERATILSCNGSFCFFEGFFCFLSYLLWKQTTTQFSINSQFFTTPPKFESHDRFLTT
jgi:hypothetical protein